MIEVISYRDKDFDIKSLKPGDLVVTFGDVDGECDIIQYTYQDPDTLIYYGISQIDDGADYFDEGNIMYIIKEIR
jgi:hypothetical protein